MKKTLLGTAIILSVGSFIWSALSLIWLGDVGDGNPILSPLRIIERDIMALAFAMLLVVIYLWIRDRGK